MTQILEPGTWNIDPSHSVVGFSARHLMVSKVRGRFTDVTGDVQVGTGPDDTTVHAEAKIASVDTGDVKRDQHLRSSDFFDVEANPVMTFASTAIAADGDNYRLIGDLTVGGVTKPVTFDVEFGGVEKDPWGGTRAGFSATTDVNRKDWGLKFNVALESGGVLVGEKVKVDLDVELVKAA